MRDIPTEGYRADEPDPNEIPSNGVIENLRNCFAEHSDLVNAHHIIIAVPTAHRHER